MLAQWITAWFMFLEKRKSLIVQQKSIQCRDYCNLDALKYQHDLNAIDWSTILEIDDANVAASTFQQMLLSICNKHAPYRSLKLREFVPSWLNTEYLSAVDAREHWCKKFNKIPTPENLAKKLYAIKFALD